MATRIQSKPDALRAACPSRDILARLGERWAMLLLVRLSGQPTRYGQLQREIEGITRKMLTQTLRRLERDGLITRRLLSRRPLAVEYALTPRAREVVPVIVSLKRWAEKNWRAIHESNAAFDRGRPNCYSQVPN
jgi:DNA-binding HxlR family transcriptional regulator